MKNLKIHLCISSVIFLFQLISGIFITVDAQNNIISSKEIVPSEEYNNISVQKISGDEKSSVFMIWVKKGVKLHKHENHSETVVVLQGKGTMTVGDEKRDIKKNDIIFIPQNTPHKVVVIKGPMKVISIQSPEFDGTDRIMLEE